MSKKFNKLLSKLPEYSQKRVRDRVSESIDKILLSEIRKMAGYTQSQLAKKMGITQSALSQLENNKNPQVSTLAKLVNAIGGELEVNARYKGKKLKVG